MQMPAPEIRTTWFRAARHFSRPAVYAFLLVPAVLVWFFQIRTGGVSLVFMIAFFLAIFLNNKHFGEMCERCLGKMPLNPDAAVKRWKWALRSVHKIINFGAKKLIAFAVIFCGIYQIAWYTLPHYSITNNVLYSVAGVTVGAFSVMASKHQQLQPWCPWCRGNGGHAHSEQPNPVIYQN